MRFITSLIVTFNPNIDVLFDLVQKLHTQTKEILIVDNCSFNLKDILILETKFSRLRILCSDKNNGLGYAQNVGILNTSNDTTHIIFFDQDSKISNDFVNSLYCFESKLLEKNYRVSAVGPKIVDVIDQKEYPSNIYQGIFSKRPIVTDYQPQDFIVSSGSLIRKEILDKVGLMKSEYFIDFIDVEWCMRAKKYGFDCFINPYLVMQHDMGDKRIELFGKKVSLHSDFRRFYTIRNGMYLMKLDYVSFQYKKITFFYNIIRFLLNVYFSKNKYKTFKFLLYGFWSGFKGLN